MAICLKGKHLNPLEKYVDVLSFEDWFHHLMGTSTYMELSGAVINVHPFLDEGSASEILFSVLFQFFFEHRGEGALSAPHNSALRDELVGRLKRTIELYPRQYEFWIELPRIPYYGDFSAEISESIKFVSNSNQFEDSYRKILPHDALHVFPEQPNSPFFCVKVNEYGDSSVDSLATSKALSLVKKVTFILAGVGALTRAGGPQRSRAILVPLDAPCNPIAVNLPDSLAKGLGNLGLNDSKLIVRDSHDEKGKAYTLLGNPGRPAKTDQERVEALTFELSRASKYFARSAHEDFERVATAIEWYQDSMHSDNQTFSYLSACIGLEALLGDKDHLDEMTKRLCDRYAFLMGKGSTDRGQLRDQYAAILKLRGSLVHAKKIRLAHADRQKLRAVQEMLFKVIWHELEAMIR